LPLLLKPSERRAAWTADIAALLLADGYVLGRFASRWLSRFSFRRQSARIGTILQNPAGCAALLFFLVGGGIVLAPNNLNLSQHKSLRSSNGNVPNASDLRNTSEVTSSFGRQPILVEGLRIAAQDVTLAERARYQATEKAPAGYHWVLASILGTNTTSKPIDLTHASVRIVDGSGRVSLPDVGEGVNNAPGGIVQPKGTALWDVGYLVKNGERTDRIEIIPTMGATQIGIFTFQGELVKRSASGG
jgi:hypothetical protein